MPAKNADKYILDALEAINLVQDVVFELIIINDHSSDKTKEVIENFMNISNYKIKIFDNIGKGKVQALNYGYTLSSGEFIKCIDADDLLLSDYFNIFHDLTFVDVHCHDAIIVNDTLINIGHYVINKSIINEKYNYILTNFVSLPRWTWTFSRQIADKIFPIPLNLPFEDVWFSLIIKKYAEVIVYSPDELYLYRQHSNQTFGGILNYDDSLIRFRANRLLKYIDILSSNESLLHDDFMENSRLMDKNYKYNKLLSELTPSVLKILSSNASVKQKMKVIVFKKFSFLAPYIRKIIWNIEKIKRI
jgi:glycosyltransferase involved in cell wall biosynthesis